jgi:hypothetical protein
MVAPLPRFPPLHFEQLSPFEQRIRLLSEATGLSHKELGEAAGLSRETVPKWVDQARKGALLPGKHAGHMKLASAHRVPIEWLTSPEPLAPGARAPIESVAHAPEAPRGQIAMLYEALGLLERRDGLTRDEAWALLLDVHPEHPSALGFYELAWRRLVARKDTR